jgi:hypothetical protein
MRRRRRRRRRNTIEPLLSESSDKEPRLDYV